MARPILPQDFQSLPPDELALLARLLRSALPFHEARKVATTLLSEFGSLPAVLFAEPVQLARAGANERVQSELALARTLQEDLARARLRQRPLIGSWTDLVAWCRITMSELRMECFRVLFLDRRNCLIADEELARGSVDHVVIHPRRVIGRALELDASAMILAHNHPSGDTSPSPDDRAMTQRIRAGAALFDITLHDHVIISRTSEYSFRSAGLL